MPMNKKEAMPWFLLVIEWEVATIAQEKNWYVHNNILDGTRLEHAN